MKLSQICLTALVLVFTRMVMAQQEGDVPSWLFVHTAPDLSFSGDQLTLPYEREIFTFTDRPNRRHGYLNAQELETLWQTGDENFGKNPPNAVLTWVSDGEVQEAEIVLVAAKVWDLGRSMTYTIRWAAGEAIPMTAGDVSLFIDSSFFDPEFHWHDCC